MTTIREAELAALTLLAQLYAEDEAKAIVRRLLSHCLSCTETALLLLDKGTAFPTHSWGMWQECLSRLTQGEPIQYVLGYTEFYNLRLSVEHGVLIPRPETEELVDLVLQQTQAQADLRLLDIGTGSGCIACALSYHMPKTCHISAMEVSDEAMAVCRKNFHHIAVATGEQIELIALDLFRWQSYKPEQAYHIIVSNPPYIHPSEADSMSTTVLEHEPHLALFAPAPNPLAYYEAIASLGSSHDWLERGGSIYLEINPLYATETLERMLEILQPRHPKGRLHLDISGKQRFISINLAE